MDTQRAAIRTIPFFWLEHIWGSLFFPGEAKAILGAHPGLQLQVVGSFFKTEVPRDVGVLQILKNLWGPRLTTARRIILRNSQVPHWGLVGNKGF